MLTRTAPCLALLCAACRAPARPAVEAHPVNRLANETSPYLLQHRDNPVDWYPWGPEALARARAESRPIFLSIGYAACHWCHVMEHESFEDEGTAALMNELFVNVKVDREERPDLDEIYMAATIGFAGHGGWPMSVFLTPDLQPFYAGTYFPPEDRHGLPGFRRVLEHVARLWRERRDEVERAAAGMARSLAQELAPVLPPGEPQWGMVAALVDDSAGRFDAEHGGFGHPPHYAPKFPHAGELAVLLREHARTGDPRARTMAVQTLTAMARGGMFDQLGGGFHRYSTDRRWLVPHFEKMLYDNAQLVRVYLEAAALTGEERFADVARDVLAWMQREMVDPQGGLWSSQDADSEGEEGRFFVWREDELVAAAGEDADLARAHFGVSAAGNFEGRNVLTLAKTAEELAAETGRPVEELRARLAALRQRLLAARRARVAPGTDDKVLVAWNGLAIAAFAEASMRLDDAAAQRAGRRAADFVLGAMLADGRLLRSWRDGAARHNGCLEDYAFLSDGLLSLFEADGDPRWLGAARELLARVRAHFLDPSDGAFCNTSDDHEALVARSKSVSESSTPSGGAVAALAFLRAGLLCGDPDAYEVGARALRAYHAWIARLPAACPTLVLAAAFHLSDPREVVVAGEPGDRRTAALLAVARRAFPRNHVLLHVHDGNRAALRELTPIVDGKVPLDGAPAAYVCRRGTCERPVTSPEDLAAALR